VTSDLRLALCVIGTLAVHAMLYVAFQTLPDAPPIPPRESVTVTIEPAPIPEPPTAIEPVKAPEPVPPTPEPVTKPIEAKRPTPVARPSRVAETAVDTPEPTSAPTTNDTTTTPVFGVAMESNSQAPGPAVKVGNTTNPDAKGPPATSVKQLAAPAAAHEVTKMPLPQGRCAGQYTDEARAAGVEGVVVLDLVVGPDGKARDIAVVEGLPHGLSEAAIAALTACRFAPGERSGERVAVRIRGFKIRFVLDAGS